jgi:hypothetical protein
MTRVSVYCFSTALAFVVFSLPLPSRAETVDCTPITSLPATISTQGIHCLTGNLATDIASGNAITITANNVTLDLNGWKVGGQAAGPTTVAVGISSSANNVTVRNGIVRGFHTGIALFGRGAVVEDLLVDQSTAVGIDVQSEGAIVRRNQVVDTGKDFAIGIESVGEGSLIEGNLVSGLTGDGDLSETGITLFRGNTLVINNFITDTAKPSGSGVSRGIWPSSGQNIGVLNNTISNMNTCIEYAIGSGGIYASNTVTGCDTNFKFGNEGQLGNNFIP